MLILQKGGVPVKNKLILLCGFLFMAAGLVACGTPPSSESVSAQADADIAAAQEPSAVSTGDHRRQDLEEYGRLERLRMEIPADAPVAVQANSFSISAQEIEALAGEYTLFNGDAPDTAYQKAQDALIAKYAVYAYACAQNCRIDEATLDALVADEQASDATNPSDFKAFLKGFGADAALYWSLHREDLRMYQTIDLFKETCSNSYADETVPFETYYAGLVAELIESENVRITS